MATGPLTTDGVPLEVLRTRRIKFLNEYNAEQNLRSLLCENVWQDTLQVDQNARTFQRLGRDTERPHRTSLDSQDITMPTPKKFGLAGGVTQDALHDGITEQQVMDEHDSAIQAHKRLVNQLIWAAVFTDGGWWDATDTPPRYGNNVMASSHDHYLAYNVSGALALTHINRAVGHISEHGPVGEIVGMFNNYTIELLANQAEWISAIPNKTPLLNRLQEFGFSTEFQAGGVPLVRNDYIPAGYGIFIDMASPKKPLAWRSATLPNVDDGQLKIYRSPENAQYYMDEEYVCWGSVGVQLRGVACPIYLGSGTYTAPTVTEWTANAL